MINTQVLSAIRAGKGVFCASVVASIALVATAGPSGGAYELSWYTIDGGGTTSASGGSFELSGTIGQPDAGSVMTGGSFSLTGGFWAGVSQTPPCPADINGDGQLNFFDVGDFLVAYSIEDPIADINDDGLFNFFDVGDFLVAYSAGCP